MAGIATSTRVLDNEPSKDLRASLDTENIQYQLVTPYEHHNNKTERGKENCAS